AFRAAGMLHLLKGEWARARSLTDRWMEMVREGNLVIQLPTAAAASAWALAQAGEASETLDRIREGEQFLERLAAGGFVINHGLAYHSLGRACLVLGRLDEAHRLADRAADFSSSQPGFAAHALRLRGDMRLIPTGSIQRAPRRTTARRSPSPSRAACARWSPT